MALVPLIAFALALQQGPASELPLKYRQAPPAAATVVAKVNGVPITAGQVEGLLWEWRGFDAIQDLIAYEVVRAEAAKQSLDVSEKDVEAAIDQGLKQMQQSLPAGKSVDVALLEQGFTRSRLYLRYRTELLISKIVERSFQPKKLVKISTLVFRPASEQTTALGEAIKKADDAYARLKKGDKWEDVLLGSTQEQAIIQSKGLIGWRSLDAFPAVVRAEMEQLSPGQFTKPSQTENGIQIFRLELAGSAATGKDLEEMKAFYMASSRQPLFDRIRKDAKIERMYPNIPGITSQKDGN